MLQEPFAELVCGARICIVLLSIRHLQKVFKERISVNKNSSLPESLQSHCRAVTRAWGLWVYVVMRDVAILEVCLVFPTPAEEKGQASECTHWWLSHPKSLWLPLWIIFYEPLAGSLECPSAPQPLAKDIEIRSLERPVLMLVNPRAQVLNPCGKNCHGNTFSFILKSVVFILRIPGGSEGSAGRKPGPGCLWCSYDPFRGKLRGGVGVTASFTQAWWLAGQLSPEPWAGRGRKSQCIRNLCISVGLKHETSLRQRCPVW